MFVKFNYRDFKNVEIVFSELDKQENLSASEKATLSKAQEILKLLSLAKDRTVKEEV